MGQIIKMEEKILKDVSRKRKYIKTFVTESGLVRNILAIAIVTLVIGLGYGLMELEIHLAGWRFTISKFWAIILNSILIVLLFWVMVLAKDILKNVLRKRKCIKTFVVKYRLILSLVIAEITVIIAIVHYCLTEPMPSFVVFGLPMTRFEIIIYGLLSAISLFCLCACIKDLILKLISCLVWAVRKFPAICRYCFVPLTEKEVRDYGFISTRDYFLYVKEQLYYGKHADEEEEYDDDEYDAEKHYVMLSSSDLREMLITCIRVFGGASVFELQKEDFIMLDESSTNKQFVLFLQDYRKCQIGDDQLHTYAAVTDCGVLLQYATDSTHSQELVIR